MGSKLNIIVRLQHWMDSVPGQTFLNYAYSWGAAIVILGALFKLTHLPGGNLMLFIGMGTEAVVFFLAAFDRPFDKQEIGKELAADFESDEEIERREALEERKATSLAPAVEAETPEVAEAPAAVVETPAPAVASAPAAVVETPAAAATQPHLTTAILTPAATTPAPESLAPSPLQAAIAAHYDQPEQATTVEAEAEHLANIIRLANDELLRRAQAVLSPDMEAATQDYIGKLQTLNATLAKVDEQSARLTRDSQVMENLNRTLVGINKVYDLHFASISRQVTTIEDINTQTQQLAAKIEEVNQIYARMMQTLSIMGNPMAAAAQTAAPQPAPQSAPVAE